MNVASLIDHTNLKPEADAAAIDKLVAEAIEHEFASVCVNGAYVKRASEALRGSSVKTCSVVGFPLGAMSARAKRMEATLACKDGADEIDFVAHLPNLLKNDVAAARSEFLEIVRDARSVNPDVVVKVIIETAVLMDGVCKSEASARIQTACTAARESGCDFVKTSTGFHALGGATIEAVKLMKLFAGPLKVKAAGGVRNYDDAVRMIEAGADRLGCSAGVAIVQGQTSTESY